MNREKLIRTARYSVRAYRPDPVEDEKLQAVLEAANPGLGTCWVAAFNSHAEETVTVSDCPQVNFLGYSRVN